MSWEEVEEIFAGIPTVTADPHPRELRMRAIGRARSDRYIFLVFAPRTVDGRTFIRTISARYMKKEIELYEKSSAQKDAVPPE